MSKKPIDDFDSGFTAGVFSACQTLAIIRGEPTYAKDILKEHGIKRDEALRLSRMSGFSVRKMNRFIREELA